MNTLAQPSSLSHPSPVPAAPVISTWKLDGSHTAVGFRVRHMMITNVRGEFRAFAGEVHFDRAHPEAAEVSVDIEVASIDTRDDKRDAHLRSADVFAADGIVEAIAYGSQPVKQCCALNLAEGPVEWIAEEVRPAPMA